MLPIVRRVVTGQSADGVSTFTHVESVEALHRSNDMRWYGVWGWPETPVLPHYDATPYAPASVFPPADGQAMRVNTVVFPAGYGLAPLKAAGPANAADAAYARLAAAQSPGGRRDANGMHATDTVELGFVQAGEICLVQGDGSEVTLRPGDVLVQNGATHAWRNRSDQPCMICFVVIGARQRAASAPTGAGRD